jgi:hypothetical protein
LIVCYCGNRYEKGKIMDLLETVAVYAVGFALAFVTFVALVNVGILLFA